MIDKIFRIILLQVPFVIIARAIDLLVIHFLDIQNLLFILAYLLWALFVILVNEETDIYQHLINAIIGAITNYVIVKLVVCEHGIIMLLSIEVLCIVGLLFIHYYVNHFLQPISVKIPLTDSDEANEVLMDMINDIIEHTDFSSCTSQEEFDNLITKELTKRLNERNNSDDDNSY